MPVGCVMFVVTMGFLVVCFVLVGCTLFSAVAVVEASLNALCRADFNCKLVSSPKFKARYLFGAEFVATRASNRNLPLKGVRCGASRTGSAELKSL